MEINDIINSNDINLLTIARARLDEAIKRYHEERIRQAINEARLAGLTVYVTTHQSVAGEIIIDDDDEMEIEIMD